MLCSFGRILYIFTEQPVDYYRRACSGSVPAHGSAVQVPASSTASQGTTATERTQQSHHAESESVPTHPAPAARCSPLFVRTYYDAKFIALFSYEQRFFCCVYYSPREMLPNIVMNVSSKLIDDWLVCLLFVCMLAYLKNHPAELTILYLLRVDTTRSSSGGVAIRYLCTSGFVDDATSCFYTIGPMARHSEVFLSDERITWQEKLLQRFQR